MKADLSLRISICLNGCPIGSRIQRKEPLPEYQHTYNNTPDGIIQAEKDMAKIDAYIAKFHNLIKRK